MGTVGVLKEGPGERRVGLTPDGVTRLGGKGIEVVVEAGAGTAAFLTDDAYVKAGARIASRDEVIATADVITCVRPPADAEALRPSQALVGLLQPLTSPDLVRALAQAKVTMISLDGLPRTLSRA